MRLTLKSKVLLLAMVPVLLFALVLSGGAVLILKNRLMPKSRIPASACSATVVPKSSTTCRSPWAVSRPSTTARPTAT